MEDGSFSQKNTEAMGIRETWSQLDRQDVVCVSISLVMAIKRILQILDFIRLTRKFMLKTLAAMQQDEGVTLNGSLDDGSNRFGLCSLVSQRQFRVLLVKSAFVLLGACTYFLLIALAASKLLALFRCTSGIWNLSADFSSSCVDFRT